MDHLQDPRKLLQLLGNQSPPQAAVTTPLQKPRKRKLSKTSDEQKPAKKRACPQGPVQAPNNSLSKPHEGIIAELSAKYNVQGASVISSTKMQKRIAYMSQHLLKEGDKPCIGLLYARPADVCKLVTISEQCKRVLKEESRGWYQYNQLFDLPPEKAEKRRFAARDAEGSTLHDEQSSGSDNEYFESVKRLDKAMLPSPPNRRVKSLRIFLTTVPVQELKARPGVTVQTSDQGDQSK